MKNKLTDEEIVKALEVCMNNNNVCANCPCYIKDLRCVCSSETDGNAVLSLIYRQKAEIEQLSNENGQLKAYNWGLEGREQELKQQVDELTDKLGKVLSGIKADKLLAARGTVRAVQDTADRIFRQVLALYQGLSKAERETMTFEWKLLDLAVEYGVEVINERKETD